MEYLNSILHVTFCRSNCHPGVAARLRKLFPRPNFLPDDSSSSAIDWIFIGSPGLGASMHVRNICTVIFVNNSLLIYFMLNLSAVNSG